MEETSILGPQSSATPYICHGAFPAFAHKLKKKVGEVTEVISCATEAAGWSNSQSRWAH